MQKKLTSLSQNTPPPRFVTESDLEEITGVKKRTWQKHRLFGRGPRWYKLHGAVRYNLTEVLLWIESNAAGGETAPLTPITGELR
jgi:hypothetical protein